MENLSNELGKQWGSLSKENKPSNLSLSFCQHGNKKEEGGGIIQSTKKQNEDANSTTIRMEDELLLVVKKTIMTKTKDDVNIQS